MLIKEDVATKKEIANYIETKFDKRYSENYVQVLIHRTNKKIKMCTGFNGIKNKYGYGYYVL